MYIKEYQIGNQLREDVIGSTYLANTTDLERAVIIKILHPNFASQSDLVQAFHNGAEKLRQLENAPLQALEHGEEDGAHYIVFEYFKLTPLEQVLEKRRLLHILDAVNLIEKIANLLRQLHLAGKVHGVLTPQSIFVDEALSSVNISDFGFDAFIHLLIQKKELKLESTLPYYAPEFIAGQAIDQRSDVYSLGVLFYRIITGALPWPQLSYSEFLNLVPKISAIPPSLQRLELPELVDGLILEMLEAEAARRCQSLEQFQEVFARVKSAILAGITPSTPPQAQTNHISRSQPNTPAFVTANAYPGGGSDSEKTDLLEDDLLVASVSGNASVAILPKTEKVVPAPANPEAPNKMAAVVSAPNPPANHVSVAPAVKSKPPALAVVVEQTDNKKAAANHQAKQNVASAPKPNVQQKTTVVSQNQQKNPAPAVKSPAPSTKTAVAVARDDEDFRETTATQTQEFATTRTININWAWTDGRAAALLFKFLVVPMSLFIGIYITLSFLDLPWARRLPNFKNSILYQKLQRVAASERDNEAPAVADQDSMGETANGLVGDKGSAREPTDSAHRQIDRSGDGADLLSGGTPPQKEIATLSAGSRSEVSAQSPPSAPSNFVTLRLFVHSAQQPLSAEVYINDKRLGKTNSQGQITISNLAPAHAYEIKVVHSGYAEWKRAVTLQNGGPAHLNVDLNLAGANLLNHVARDTQRGSVTVLLSNALALSNAFVYVNGRLWDGPENMAPTKFSLPAGQHTIEIRKQGFRSDPPSQIIDLKAGENKTLSFLLIPTPN